MPATFLGRLSMALAGGRDLIAGSASRFTRTRRKTMLNQDSPQDEQDSVLAMLARSPGDDEPVTDDDRRHIAEGWEAYREGRVVSSEEAKQACLDAKGETNPREANRAVPV
jgi:hypothetical protein